MKITLQSSERFFDATVQFVISERVKNENHIVAASYVGVPESVVAVSAGIIEARSVIIEGEEYHRGADPFRRMEKRIGLGDVAHGIIYNSLASIQGVEEIGEKSNRAYIISVDGNMDDAVAEHVIRRFGLPYEWKEHYSSLFNPFYSELDIVRNPEFSSFYPNIRAIRFDGDESEVLEMVEMALKNGMLRIPQSDVHGVFDRSWSMKEYMVNNAETMGKKLQEMRPKHMPTDNLEPAIAQMGVVPFPAQAHVIQALVNGLDVENSVTTSANMGCGKSIQANGVVNVIHNRKRRNGAKRGTTVLLSAPGITLTKWEKKEIGKTLPHAKTQIIRSSEEALRLLNKVRNGYRPTPTDIEYTLIGIDKAKLGSEPFFAGVWKRVKGKKSVYGWHCPDCGRLLYKKEEGTNDWIPLQWSDVAWGTQPTDPDLGEKIRLPNGLPKGYKVKWRKSKKFTKCSYRKEVGGYLPESEVQQLLERSRSKADEELYKQAILEASCHSKLWRPAVKNRGETRNRPRVNISRIFKRMKKYFDIYICDEVHQAKGNSGRGDAFAQMVRAAKKNLLLTGTLVNGKSTSIKEILWRTDQDALIEHGISDKTGDIAWAERFGKVKQVVTLSDEVDENGWVTRQRRKPQQPVEEPGISPQMTAQFLLHKTTFLDLDDLGLPLVELHEKPIFINMDPEHGVLYSNFHEEMYEECKNRAWTGSKGAWSKFVPATINYADRPDLGAYYTFPNMEGEDTVITSPKIEGYHAKERWLIDRVKQELSENRGVVIYNNYTGEYEMNERTQQILRDHGIESEILNEPNTEKRGDVLNKLANDGVQVIITNMKLVEVGLDMLAWPTIIFNQLSYEVNVVRQSGKRSHRIGQHKECRVFIPVYNGTQQMAQFLKIMAARGHALMTEGRLDRGELAKYARDDQSSLASDLASCFADSNVATDWTTLAVKELEGLEIVEESMFKEVLEQRMIDLANETRRLCGVPVIDINTKRLEVTAEEEHNLFSAAESYSNESGQLDPFEMYDIQVVEIRSYKKRSRKKPVENQLAFNF
ncbi:hypothetical protein V1503_24160 [Bacillus sp. SCS-151]|uniref:hypothetical protein n=1 Tax=Nanhaiella sioensis TaxID=3115293 RepID=UPI003979B6CB